MTIKTLKILVMSFTAIRDIFFYFLKIIFTSGQEMYLESGTVVVDCARNSTRFPVQQEKVFDGDKIKLQFIMLPPLGLEKHGLSILIK